MSIILHCYLMIFLIAITLSKPGFVNCDESFKSHFLLKNSVQLCVEKTALNYLRVWIYPISYDFRRINIRSASLKQLKQELKMFIILEISK